MKRTLLLPAVWLLDRLAGDPEWLPHPVRVMGLTIANGESALRRESHSDNRDLISGAALTLSIIAGSYYLSRQVIHVAYRKSPALGNAVELLLGWTCLAARSLKQEAEAVIDTLEAGDLELSRTRLARIVGRDTHQLDVSEISRAVIETLAESTCDGIISPLFYLTLGGVPLAMAYKAANTLDSMIGHTDARYFYFGKVAARLDDIANFLPARITSLEIVVASAFIANAHPRSAWQTWHRDGSKHKSPNAGQAESAMSGALQVRLGGNNAYDGEVIPAERMGEEFPQPSVASSRRAIRIITSVTILGVACGILLSTCSQSPDSKSTRL